MLEPATPNPIPIEFNPHPRQSLLTMKPEFEISEILDSKIDNQCHACKLLYLVDGQGMRAPTKKPPGSSLPNSLRISTLPIQPSLVLCQALT